MTAYIIPSRDFLLSDPYTSGGDESSYSETPTGKEIELRVAHATVGTGTLIARRTSVTAGQIPAAERIGRQIDTMSGAAGDWTAGTATTISTAGGAPSGYTTALNKKFAVAGLTTGNTSSNSKALVADYSVYGGGASLTVWRYLTSLTNVGSARLRFEFATAADYAEFEVGIGATLSTWEEHKLRKGAPTGTGGTVDWSNVKKLYLRVAASGGTVTSDVYLRDLRIGTVQTDKTVPDGYIAWESSVDVRRRYRDNATAKATTTLAALSAAAATNVKVTSVTNMVAGDDLTLETATGFVETRTIQTVGTAGGGGSGVTVTAAFTYAHANTDPAVVYYWGPWGGWDTIKASQPPVATLSSPADAASVTDPTTLLDWTYSSPGSKLQRAYTVVVYQRVSGVDQEIANTGRVLSVATDYTLPAFLLTTTGQTIAWDVTVEDTDGLTTTSARRTFTSSFSAPAAPTALTATPDADTSSVALAWTASAGPNVYEHRVYWRNGVGTFVQVATVGAAATTYTDAGARPGDNEYQVTAHTGAMESAAATAEATLTALAGGSGAFVREDDERHTIGFIVYGAPRTREPGVESFRPPGRGVPVHLKWGISGRHVSVTIKFRPVADGDMPTLFDELLDGDLPGWLKFGAGWLRDPLWCQVVGVSDQIEVGGWAQMTVEFEETS